MRKGQCYRIVREALIASNRKIRYRLIHYAIQGNHLHLIVEADDMYALSRAMRGLSIRIARRVNQLMGARGVRIRDRYVMTVLKTPLAVQFALRYVLNNYRRHAATWGRKLPDGWIDPCSSARWFDGWAGRPTRSRDPCPDLPSGIVPPRSDVLRRDWRMYGLLEPSFVPGPHRDRHA